MASKSERRKEIRIEIRSYIQKEKPTKANLTLWSYELDRQTNVEGKNKQVGKKERK